jgi:outer membrane protein
MKKLIVAGVMALGFLGSSAQTKIGYVNSEEVMAAMTEYKEANKEMQEYQESLNKQYEDLDKEASDKSAQFIKDSATLSASLKEIKREEIIKLYQRIQNYQTEAQEKSKQTAQLKFAPIQQKAMDAIKAAAKRNGYTYIFESNTLLVMPPGDDILSLVKKELGIVDAPAKLVTPPAKQIPVKTGN